jgi:hypothetical protein
MSYINLWVSVHLSSSRILLHFCSSPPLPASSFIPSSSFIFLHPLLSSFIFFLLLPRASSLPLLKLKALDKKKLFSGQKKPYAEIKGIF